MRYLSTPNRYRYPHIPLRAASRTTRLRSQNRLDPTKYVHVREAIVPKEVEATTCRRLCALHRSLAECKTPRSNTELSSAPSVCAKLPRRSRSHDCVEVLPATFISSAHDRAHSPRPSPRLALTGLNNLTLLAQIPRCRHRVGDGRKQLHELDV